MIDQFGDPMKHTFLMISASVALYTISAAIFTARSGRSSPLSPQGKGNIDVEQSTVPRQLDPCPSAADLAAAVYGISQFGFQAAPLLARGTRENLVFSPYGMSQALALAATGAAGETQHGIAKAMCFSMPENRLNPALNQLNLKLRTHQNGAQENRDSVPRPSIRLDSAIWMQTGFPLLPAYLDTIALNFGAGVRRADFMNDAGEASEAINAWSAAHNKGLTASTEPIAPNGTITHDARLVLTNAIWFKAGWASPFDAKLTQEQAFITDDGSRKMARFMHQTLTVPHLQDNDVQAVELPYAGSFLSMLIVMPKTATVEAFLSCMTPPKLNGLVNRLADDNCLNVALPKFSFDNALDMGPTLLALGMHDAFDADAADFSRIVGKQALSMGSVLHQAHISVDERGTEASAGAAGAAQGGAHGERPAYSATSLRFDRPFLFFVRDRQTGAILFMGKILKLPGT